MFEKRKFKAALTQIEKNQDETDCALLDLQHRLMLVRQEKDSLQTRLRSSQVLAANLKKESKANEERLFATQNSESKLQNDLETKELELLSAKKVVEECSGKCRRLTKELR